MLYIGGYSLVILKKRTHQNIEPWAKNSTFQVLSLKMIFVLPKVFITESRKRSSMEILIRVAAFDLNYCVNSMHQWREECPDFLTGNFFPISLDINPKALRSFHWSIFFSIFRYNASIILKPKLRTYQTSKSLTSLFPRKLFIAREVWQGSLSYWKTFSVFIIWQKIRQ